MNDEFFQALASPYRREIIRLLKQKSLNAGEIASHFTISKPSVSHHLEVLRQAELVTVERRGTQLIYSVNLTVLQEMGMELIELVSTKERVSNEP